MYPSRQPVQQENVISTKHVEVQHVKLTIKTQPMQNIPKYIIQ